MRFNKKQLEIIAYCLSNLEGDCENADTKKQMHGILGDLQEKGLWGRCKFYNECEKCETSLTPEEFEHSNICSCCYEGELENHLETTKIKTSFNDYYKS